MKYRLDDTAIESLDDLEKGKVRVKNSDHEDGIVETPWVAKMSDGRQVLLNHAVNMYPYESWGAVLPEGYEQDIKDFWSQMEIPVHKEAWDVMVDKGIINEKGEYIKKEE